ncbi:MAG: hypothetical protein K2L12_02630 [Clostridia bacterium]|nr:hypothetical protein [Clostridia bacterium]
MKRLHLRFYPYILACVFLSMLVIILLVISAFAFVRTEIGMGIGSVLLAIIFNFSIWLILKGGIVIDYKKNRLTIFSGIKREVYAVDKIKEISISFRFDESYKRWSAKVKIYFNNDQPATFAFDPHMARLLKIGITLHNKERIERNAKKCNFIRCYTVK